MSYVRCQMSDVRCHMSDVICILLFLDNLFSASFNSDSKPWENKEGCTGVEFGEEVRIIHYVILFHYDFCDSNPLSIPVFECQF